MTWRTGNCGPTGGVAAASRLPAATPLATAVGPTLAQLWPRWLPSRALRCWPTTTGTTTTGDPSTRTIPAKVATGGEKSAWTAACAWTCGVASSSQAPHCRCMNATAPRPSGLLWGAGVRSGYATCAWTWTVATRAMAHGWCCGRAQARAAKAGPPVAARSGASSPENAWTWRMAGSARAHTPWSGPATAAPANAGGGKEGPMMITPQSPHAMRTMLLLFSAAAAGTFALACASAAQAADAPVSSPTSPPKVTTTAQKPAAPSRANRLQAICSSADLNHDGKVSLEEFHRDIVQGWHNLSPDATGHVQLSDLAQVPRRGKGRLKRLAAVDTDSDGKLSFKEVVESRMAYFDAADTDQDDQLSLSECVAYERQRRGSKP